MYGTFSRDCPSKSPSPSLSLPLSPLRTLPTPPNPTSSPSHHLEHMRSSASSTLSDHSDSVPASPQPTVRTKRWASESEVDFDRDDTEDVQPLKRARPSAGGFGDPVSAKPSPSDKDDRKRARMMRNRSKLTMSLHFRGGSHRILTALLHQTPLRHPAIARRSTPTSWRPDAPNSKPSSKPAQTSPLLKHLDPAREPRRR